MMPSAPYPVDTGFVLASRREAAGAPKPFVLPLWPLWTLLGLSLLASLYAGFVEQTLPNFARYTTPALGVLSLLIAIVLLPRAVEIGLSGSILPFLIAWRVGAIDGSIPVMAASGVTAVYFVALYLDHAGKAWRHATSWAQRLEWQTTLVRLYFGFDMVGHFTEKLFAGSASFTHMATQFEGFGLPDGGLFVILGGLCELAVAVGIGMGVLTRLAGVGGALYFLVANHFGGHFANGFTWSNRPDGGWEYSLLMVVFYLSFALAGAGRFSVDGWLLARGLMPRWARPLAVALPTGDREP